MDSIPELIKLSLVILRDVEPLVTDALPYTDEYVDDTPTSKELKYYESIGSKFQIIFLVINSIYYDSVDGISNLLPFSMSLIPASKRGEVETSNARFVASMAGNKFFDDGAAYMGLDPFAGEWSFFSQAGLIADLGAKRAMTDELGLVYDHFFLRLGVDSQDILQAVTVDLPKRRLKQYLKHRSKLLYTPFTKLRARQIWGVQNALELFVYSEIHRQGLPIPIPQALLYSDGSWHPGLYNAWQYFGEKDDPDFISETDFFFPDQRIAVFCDGATHNRLRIKERDSRIDAALSETGITSIRISSKKILADVEGAVNEIKAHFQLR